MNTVVDGGEFVERNMTGFISSLAPGLSLTCHCFPFQLYSSTGRSSHQSPNTREAGESTRSVRRPCRGISKIPRPNLIWSWFVLVFGVIREVVGSCVCKVIRRHPRSSTPVPQVYNYHFYWHLSLPNHSNRYEAQR